MVSLQTKKMKNRKSLSAAVTDKLSPEPFHSLVVFVRELRGCGNVSLSSVERALSLSLEMLRALRKVLLVGLHFPSYLNSTLQTLILYFGFENVAIFFCWERES